MYNPPLMTKTTIAIMALVAVILTSSTVYANNGVPTSITDLESSFTGFEVFLTDLSNEVNTNMVSITNLQGNQTSILTTQSIIQGNITSIDTRVTDLESGISGFSAQISALPVLTSVTKSDSNSPTCEVTPYPFAFNDWCPNSFVGSFDISDVDVSATSLVFVSVKGSPLSICGVTDIDDGVFRVRCNTGPTNGAELHYMIVN